MLDPKKDQSFLNKHRTLIIGFFVVVIVILFTIPLLISRNQSSTSSISDSSVLPQTTITPTLESRTFNPPTSVDLDQVNVVVKATQAPYYQIDKLQPAEINPKSIISQFDLSSDPEIIQTGFIHLKTWKGKDYYLSQNIIADQITLGINHESQINKVGSFSSPDQLAQNAISLVKSLQIFASSISFKLERFNYYQINNEWPEPVDNSQAQVIEIVIIPIIDNLPIYQQEKSFILATYDHKNKLIKLDIHNPISGITKIESKELLSFEQIKKGKTSDFFRLFVKPSNSQELFLSPSDIQTLKPDSLSLGLFLNGESVYPIYLLNSDNSTYAIKAID